MTFYNINGRGRSKLEPVDSNKGILRPILSPFFEFEHRSYFIDTCFTYLLLLNNLVCIFLRSKHTRVRSRIWSWRIQNLCGHMRIFASLLPLNNVLDKYILKITDRI